MKKYLFILLFYSGITYAMGGFSDHVEYNYIGIIEQQIPTWIEVISKFTLKIFTILWCIETFTQVVFKNVLGNDMKKLPIYFITRICFGGFFAFVFLKPDVYLGIIQFIGSSFTNISFNHDHTIKGLDASGVFKQFQAWETLVYNPHQESLFWGLKSFTYGILYVVYLVCTLFIMLMIIFLEVEIYLIVFGGLVLTGFAGSSWTFGLWNKYLDTIIGLGVRVLVFGMLYGLFKGLITINPDSAGIMDVLTSTCSIFLTTACLYVIPSKVAGIASGSAKGNGLGEAIGMGIATVATGGYLVGKGIDTAKDLHKSGKNIVNTGRSILNSVSNALESAPKPTPPKPMPPDWSSKNGKSK